jgi:hypothetical protein
VTVKVAVCPGFKVSGVKNPVAPKRDPATESAEIVTGAVPEEVRVTDCVPVLPTETFPKVTVDVLKVRTGVAAFSCSKTDFDVLPLVAVRVADCAVATEATPAVKRPFVDPAGIVMLAGTVTALLLLARFTVSPPVGAEPDKLSVQVSASVPMIEALLQETALTVGAAAMPAPLMFTVAVGALPEMVRMPV